MNPIIQIADVILIGIILLPALIGAIYGFFSIFFSLAVWALSLGIAIKFLPALHTHLLFIESQIMQIAIAFLSLFIFSLIILSGISLLITKLLGKMGLTAADRILGFFLGCGFGIIIIETIIFVCGFTGLSATSWWQTSHLIAPFEKTAVWVGQYLPENITKYHHY